MARNRAVILHGMWIEGTEFKWSSKEAAATDFPPIRSARTNVPAGTLALVRSPLVSRCSREQNALHTLIPRVSHIPPVFSCAREGPLGRQFRAGAEAFVAYYSFHAGACRVSAACSHGFSTGRGLPSPFGGWDLSPRLWRQRLLSSSAAEFPTFGRLSSATHF